MGKTESKIAESYTLSEPQVRRYSEQNHKRTSTASNLSIYTSSWNIVKPSLSKRYTMTNLGKTLQSQQILFDTEKLLMNIVPTQLSKHNNLCMVTSSMAHTLKENFKNIEEEDLDAEKDPRDIDIFIRGFMKFMNIFSSLLETKFKLLVDIIKVFKRSSKFQNVFLQDKKRINSLFNAINLDTQPSIQEFDFDQIPSSGRKSRNLGHNKVYENTSKAPDTTIKTLKKGNMKSLNNISLGTKSLKSTIISTATNNGKQPVAKNIMIEDNSKKKVLPNRLTKPSTQFQKNKLVRAQVSPEIKKKYSPLKVLNAESNPDYLSSIDYNSIYAQTEANEKDYQMYRKKDEEPLFYQPKMQIMNLEYNKNRLVRSVNKIEKNSMKEFSVLDCKNLTMARGSNLKSSLAGKESSQPHKLQKAKTNQSLQITHADKQQFSSRVSSTNNSSSHLNFNSSLKKPQETDADKKGLNLTLHKKKNTVFSVKSSKLSNTSNKSTIEYDDTKPFSKKTEKHLSSSSLNIAKAKSNSKTHSDKPTPTIVYEVKGNPKQNHRSFNDPDKGYPRGTVQQLNVKININQLNQLQTNNNTINNIYDSNMTTPKVKKNIKLEKDIIMEEKENYSSPDSNNGKILVFPTRKQTVEKNESSNSESETNIDVINANRHNTPAFNHVHKRSNSSGNTNNLEFNKKKRNQDNEVNLDEKFSFRGSGSNSIVDENEDDDADFNYNNAIKYIVPRMGSIEKQKKLLEQPHTMRAGEPDEFNYSSNKLPRFNQRYQENDENEDEVERHQAHTQKNANTKNGKKESSLRKTDRPMMSATYRGKY